MKLEKIIGEGPADERQQNVRDQASWMSFLAILAAYFGIGITYAFKGQQIPWSTELVVSLAIFMFAGYTISKEGISFRHPWLPDNETTLAQSSIIRCAPWILLMSGYLGLVGAVIQSIYGWHHPSEFGFVADLIGTLAFAVIGFGLNVYFAKRMRMGKPGTIWLFRFLGVLAVIALIGIAIFAIVVATQVPSIAEEMRKSTSGDFGMNWMSNVSTVIAWLPIYVVFRYGKRMIEDGKSFNK